MIWIAVILLAIFIGYKLLFSVARSSDKAAASSLGGRPVNQPIAKESLPPTGSPLAPPLPAAIAASAAVEPRLVADAPAAPALVIAFLAQCLRKINSEAADTFQARIATCEAQVSQAATLTTYLGAANISSADYQLVSNQYVLTVASSFIQDAQQLRQQAGNADQVLALEEIKASMNKLRGLLHNLRTTLRPTKNALKACATVTEILEEATTVAEERIRQYYATTLGGKVSPASEQLFNLGFYLLNSENLFVLPTQPVTKGLFDFKTEFFPTFDAIKWPDYLTAKTLFELAIKADPANLLAAIYREVARLHAAMRTDYADEDREDIIRCLQTIVAGYPRHALGHIELAQAYASVSAHTLAAQHTELALAIDPASIYLQYSAMLVYRNLYERDKEEELRRSLRIEADDAHNPRVYYMSALGLTEPQTLLMAFMQIEKAIQYGKSKEYFWLRNQILRYLKNSLSDKEYESLRGEELTSQGEAEVRKLQQRESRFTMEQGEFLTVSSLVFAPDYAFVDIWEQDAALPLRFQLAENQVSVVLLDFNLTLAAMASLSTFIFPATLSSGKFYLEKEGFASAGNIYLKGLAIESLVKII